MKIFDKWIYKKWLQARDHWNTEPIMEDMKHSYANSTGILIKGNERLQSRGMQFTVYQANGGHILEYNSYDPITDRHNGSLHIIPADSDMGQTIAHVITLELLKK